MLRNLASGAEERLTDVLAFAFDDSAKVLAYTVVARYGGEEFAIVLPSTPKAGALGYGERIKRIVASYPFPTGTVTISIGTATLPGDAESRDDLISAADRALYRAKQEGRNRVGG